MVAMGRFGLLVKGTGRRFESDCAIHFEVIGGEISACRTFEDSYAVAAAYRIVVEETSEEGASNR